MSHSFSNWVIDDADYKAMFPDTQPPRRGFAPSNVKLSPTDILAIRAAYDAGTKGYSIARQYGIAQSTVSRIGNRKQQGWVS